MARKDIAVLEAEAKARYLDIVARQPGLLEKEAVDLACLELPRDVHPLRVSFVDGDPHFELMYMNKETGD